MVVLVRLLRIDGEQGELGDELQGLAQNVAFGDVVRFRVVRIEGKHAAGELFIMSFEGAFMMMSRTKEGGRVRKSAKISQKRSSWLCVGRCPNRRR